MAQRNQKIEEGLRKKVADFFGVDTGPTGRISHRDVNKNGSYRCENFYRAPYSTNSDIELDLASPKELGEKYLKLRKRADECHYPHQFQRAGDLAQQPLDLESPTLVAWPYAEDNDSLRQHAGWRSRAPVPAVAELSPKPGVVVLKSLVASDMGLYGPRAMSQEVSVDQILPTITLRGIGKKTT